MQGLIINYSETDGDLAHVIGTFEGKPFEMRYNAEEATGEVDGDSTMWSGCRFWSAGKSNQ